MSDTKQRLFYFLWKNGHSLRSLCNLFRISYSEGMAIKENEKIKKMRLKTIKDDVVHSYTKTIDVYVRR